MRKEAARADQPAITRKPLQITKESENGQSTGNNQERRSRCFTLAKDLGVEPIQVALAFVLHQPFPSFPLIGPRNFFETKSSLKALKINLTKEESKWLDLRSN